MNTNSIKNTKKHIEEKTINRKKNYLSSSKVVSLVINLYVIVYFITVAIVFVISADSSMDIRVLIYIGLTYGFIGLLSYIVSIYVHQKIEYKELEKQVLDDLGFQFWNIVPFYDEQVFVNSNLSLNNYNSLNYFKDIEEDLKKIEISIYNKTNVKVKINTFLLNNKYKSHYQYKKIEKKLLSILLNSSAYRVQIIFSSVVGKHLGEKYIEINENDIKVYKSQKQSKEYTTHSHKKHIQYYNAANEIIKQVNKNKSLIIVDKYNENLDILMTILLKDVNNTEWEILDKRIHQIQKEVNKIFVKNHRISEYYKSTDFQNVKTAYKTVIISQQQFNDYITEKVQSINKCFGSKVAREETIYIDSDDYVRQYKKELTPFTAEVSKQVFESAENNPLEYVIKYFYPNKKSYPKQIENLYLLVGELQTLREAKQIIENHKETYRHYIINVPSYILEEDEQGFYARLGYANIDEKILNVAYKFSYTSGGGKTKRTFAIPMTEVNIVKLIRTLENKISASSFTKEQRNLMTKKLRDYIKSRDNYTCKRCGNSTYKEPNLLLEIDHIIPISKGGRTVSENLQTLCWKCNREKSDKIYKNR